MHGGVLESGRGAGNLLHECAEHLPAALANVIASHSQDCSEEGCAPGCAVAHLDAHADGRRPSRILYCPKARGAERDAGCEQLPARALDLFPNAQHDHHAPPARNPHPTVKPLALMRWLVRLATPTDGLVVDPFCGSGSTGCAALLEHRRFLGIERNPAYIAIARARIDRWHCLAGDPAERRKSEPADYPSRAPGPLQPPSRETDEHRAKKP